MGLNFFSRVFSLVSVPELRRSEYFDSKVCSSSSDHFLRFIFFGAGDSVDEKSGNFGDWSGGVSENFLGCERPKAKGECRVADSDNEIGSTVHFLHTNYQINFGIIAYLVPTF